MIDSPTPAAVRPVVLAVDDDPAVLRAVERDLRARYGRDYRVVRASSGAAALDIIAELDRRGEPLALMVVDHRMPDMDGIAFLTRARVLAPAAKRVLLTAYAETEAAIRAINTVRLDYYLMKPWDPPADHLYPVLDDLLEDWRADFRPEYQGVRVIDHRWSPAAHALRDFLTRNQVPYHWLDLARDPAARITLAATAEQPALPLVILPDGTRLAAPAPAALASALGLQTRARRPFYDLIIVGGGPAGLAAAVYGASEGLRTVLIEKIAPGGQAGMSSRIENYLGFPSGVSGGDLARRAVAQAGRFGVEMLSPQHVTGFRREDPYRIVTLADGTELSCLALVVATGVFYRRLEAPGVERLSGAGVYYGGGLSEMAACAGEDVFVIGGANSAGQAAMSFARAARSVTMLVRGSGLEASMSQYLIDQIAATPTIHVRPRTTLTAVHGESGLSGVTFRDRETGEETTCPAGAVFIFIGAVPHTDWLGDQVERDEQGFLLTGADLDRDASGRWRHWPLARDPYLLESCVPGVFVAGDVRHNSIKRVASGVGEGAIAVSFVHQYLAQARVYPS